MFENLVFATTSKILGILKEYIDKVRSFFKSPIKILNILELIAKTSFSRIAKCSTLNSHKTDDWRSKMYILES